MNLGKVKTFGNFHLFQMSELINFPQLPLNITFIFNFNFNLTGNAFAELDRAFCQYFNGAVIKLGSLQELVKIGTAT